MGHNSQPIDLVINNAGARFDDHQKSPEGFERTFATNHLGHFLLTALLWNSVASAPAARIAAISSSAHRNARPSGDWLWRQNPYDSRQAYACSKLANILFIRELARRADAYPVVPVAVDPGILMTRFALNNGWIPWLKHWVSHGARRELDSVKATAHWIVENLLNGGPQDLRGQLIGKRGLIHPAATDNDEALARELWESSLRWAGLDQPEAGGVGPFSTGKISSVVGATNAC
jgi:NAD(P)-dependent dehydrogenase (short-subunit alcohol dehydrogenase family)